MAFEMPEPGDRIMVAAYCAECRNGYTMIMGRGWTWQPEGYCSKPCSRRAYLRRYRTRCPNTECGRTKRPDAVVCGHCWIKVTASCRGKRPLTEPKARQVEASRSWLAVWCRCCGWWHNTSHPTEDEEGLVREIGNILEAMRRVKGQVWVNEMIESWHPDVFDRHAWKAERS